MGNSMDSLLESALNAAALRPALQGPFAEAARARELLAAMVTWHAANEAEILPTPLLTMLVAARYAKRYANDGRR